MKHTQKQNTIVGIVKRNPDGFGFLIPDDKTHQDIYIPRHEMTGIMTNDRVEVFVKREREGRFSGAVKEIVERSLQNVVGCLHLEARGDGLLIDEGQAWGEHLLIPKHLLKGAQQGMLVAAKVLSFPGSGSGFTGEVIEVLGTAGDPLLDTKQCLYVHSVPVEFSKETLSESEKIPLKVSDSELKGRKDLRHLKFVTIDGATARDFDDAVYGEKTHEGFKVWVAIADVSHYVREGSAIDEDAYERGTSVYFPDKVVPMLPERLSNGICSLNPHEDRLAMVAEMNLDFKGEIVKSEFYEAVFCSRHRMIYGEVQEILDGFPIKKFEDVTEDLKLLKDIATILMHKRFREGSLDLEIPEPQILINSDGIPTDVIRTERLFSHKLIEELMLLANVAVARFISGSGYATLYRIHEEPFDDALKDLEIMAHNWGVKARLQKKFVQKELMKLLEKEKGRPEEHILSILILRSMKQAQYSAENKGHFGLAFNHYVHFTSPIRRYPDLIVHRTLKRILKSQGGVPTEKMATAGTFLSACEQRANVVTRELLAIKKCRFMVPHVGKEFEGIVTGVHKFGFFVQLRIFDIDGLVKVEALKGDRYQFIEEGQKLIGKHTGNLINLGDVIKVKVVRSDPDAQEIDFEWIDEPNANTQRGKTDRQDSEERGAIAPNRERLRQARFSQRGRKGSSGSFHPKKANKKRKSRNFKRR